jgi:predicted outer membrane repeat protein
MVACALLLALPSAAHATTLHVSVVGNDATGLGSLARPYATVQKAVNMAVWGDVVSVGPGTFNGNVTMKPAVSLHGAGALLTTLRGTGSGPVVTASNIGATAGIWGFTITGGNADKGGGIYCYQSSPAITDNTITGNVATLKGGGIYCDSSSAGIRNNVITGNSAAAGSDNMDYNPGGGGIYCWYSRAAITGNTISGNSATGNYGNGGGILVDNSPSSTTTETIAGNTITGNSAVWGGGIWVSSSPAITGNTIAGNSAYYGGGIYCCALPCSPAITNNTVVGNNAIQLGGGIVCLGGATPAIRNDTIAGNSGGASGGGIYNESAPPPTITNCIVWGNSSGLHGCSATYSDVQNGLGSISVDPGFVAAQDGDYRLAAGSPCIDVATSAGAPATDKNGIGRPWGGGCDMGAYEYFAPTLASTTKISGPASVKVRRSLRLTGTVVAPWGSPGTVKITKTRLVGTRWRSAGSATVHVVGGSFTYSFKPSYRGRWRFVAHYSGGVIGPTTYLSSKSGIKSVRVR